MNFLDMANLLCGFVPLDLQSQRNGGWVEVPVGKKLIIILYKGAGTDGDDPVLTTQQAQSSSGTNVKNLNFTTLWRRQATDLQAFTNWITETQAPASSYTNTDGHQQLFWVVEFTRDDLDIAGGFNHVRATLNDTGTNAQLGCVLYITIGEDVGESMTRSAGAFLGTNESTGVSLAAGAASQGSEVDLLADDTSRGDVLIYARWTCPSAPNGKIRVTLQRIKTTGGLVYDVQPPVEVAAGASGANKALIGRFPAGRYMSAKVQNLSDVALTNMAVLYELEKVS